MVTHQKQTLEKNKSFRGLTNQKFSNIQIVFKTGLWSVTRGPKCNLWILLTNLN